jgi:hypothetical protein
MTHPLDQLAAFVDGALDPPERAEVERHVASCDRCRREVATAAAGRRVMRSLPEVSAPAGLGDAAIAEAAAHARRPASGAPRWTRLVPVAAAAVIVGLLALALLRIGGGGEDTETAADAGGAAALATAPKDLRLELQHTDYDPDSLTDAARAFASTSADLRTPAAQPTGDEALGGQEVESGTRVAGPARVTQALRCLETAFPGYPGRPVRLVQATFDGTPAYLAYVLEGPGAEQPPDTVSIRVASIRGCGILSLTSARI